MQGTAGLVVLAMLVAAMPAGCESAGRSGTADDDDQDTETGSDADGDGDTDTGSGTGDGSGCKGVDFLFAIDSSISMADEQQNLINSFPGFMSAINETLGLDDFHIMVVDSDSIYVATSSIERHACSTPGCCATYCAGLFVNAYDECSETAASPYYTCNEWETGDPQNPKCNDLLGGSHVGANQGVGCVIDGGNRYLIQGQADLDQTFACIADVGTEGSGFERLMEAMVLAVGPWNAAGHCNAGFIREDAILVVTFITDEDEACTLNGEICSEGDPGTWKQALVDAKGGNGEAIVMLGVFGDNDLPSGICQPINPVSGSGAEAAPLLRSLIDQFGEQGHYCSVCLSSYDDCFLDAVATIDTTCDELVVE